MGQIPPRPPRKAPPPPPEGPKPRVEGGGWGGGGSPVGWLARRREAKRGAAAEKLAQTQLALGANLIKAISADDLQKAREDMDDYWRAFSEKGRNAKVSGGAIALREALSGIQTVGADGSNRCLLRHCSALGKHAFANELFFREFVACGHVPGDKRDIRHADLLYAMAMAARDSMGRRDPWSRAPGIPDQDAIEAASAMASLGADPLAPSGTPQGSALAEAVAAGCKPIVEIFLSASGGPLEARLGDRLDASAQGVRAACAAIDDSLWKGSGGSRAWAGDIGQLECLNLLRQRGILPQRPESIASGSLPARRQDPASGPAQSPAPAPPDHAALLAEALARIGELESTVGSLRSKLPAERAPSLPARLGERPPRTPALPDPSAPESAERKPGLRR